MRRVCIIRWSTRTSFGTNISILSLPDRESTRTRKTFSAPPNPGADSSQHPRYRKVRPLILRETSVMAEVRAASPGRRLRDELSSPPVQLPGVFNALVARIAERLGFRAVYLSGAALSASYALPDVGLVTLSELASAARAITQATKLPLICD